MGWGADLNDPNLSRRQLFERVGGGLMALTVSTAWGELTPAEARAKDAPFKHLTAAEGARLEALGEVLLPGAREAGVAHFVDDQLGRPDSLLFLKYMEYPSPQLDFYRDGLAALNGICQKRNGASFTSASDAQRVAMVAGNLREKSRRLGRASGATVLFRCAQRRHGRVLRHGGRV
jgi:hypothetical protein